uniref:Cryptogene protein G3 n=1 Tax=Leishmania tarentolae TaxID=5689 RepID=Q7M3S7_LEITA
IKLYELSIRTRRKERTVLRRGEILRVVLFLLWLGDQIMILSFILLYLSFRY